MQNSENFENLQHTTAEDPDILDLNRNKANEVTAKSHPSPKKNANVDKNMNTFLDNVEAEDEYIVEKIIKKRIHPELRYLVKWRDWDIKYSTWEPLEHLINVTTLIDEFEKKEALKDLKKTSSKSGYRKKNSDEEWSISDTSDSEVYNFKYNKSSFRRKPPQNLTLEAFDPKIYDIEEESYKDNLQPETEDNYVNKQKQSKILANKFENKTIEPNNEINNNDNENNQKPFKVNKEKKYRIKPKEFKEKVLSNLNDNEICYNINNILDNILHENVNDSDQSFQKIISGRRRGRKRLSEQNSKPTDYFLYNPKTAYKSKNNQNSPILYKNEKKSANDLNYYRQIRSTQRNYNQYDTEEEIEMLKKKFNLTNDNDNDFNHINEKKAKEKDTPNNLINLIENNEQEKIMVDGYLVYEEIPETEEVETVVNVKVINDKLHCLVRFREQPTGLQTDDGFVPSDIITLKEPTLLINFYESKIVFR